jgi:putative ABC transport system ATP-binding protein
VSLIEIRDVSKRYDMGRAEVVALDGVTFLVETGEYVAIMGPSGSGKSTLMNIVGCLDRPTSGTYHLAGRPVEEYSDDELARVRSESIGFVFQTFHLMPRADAWHNVELPLVYAGVAAPARAERVHRALEEVGLADRARHRPSELSGGQRQRVAVARALVNSPAILLADEPTGNLDTKTASGVFDLLRSFNRELGTAFLIVTHDAGLAARCDRIVELVDGRIVRDEVSREAVDVCAPSE